MFILRAISFGLISLALLAGNSWAQDTSTFEGMVRDSKGKAVKGAEVCVEAKNKQIIAKGKTDAKGHYVTAPVATGTYKVDLMINSVAKASVAKAKTNKSGATQLNFDIVAGTQKKRVWVKDTGSQFGHWEDVDDANASAGNSNLSKGDAASVRRMQEKAGQALPSDNP
jgi:hypothetical protein